MLDRVVQPQEGRHVGARGLRETCLQPQQGRERTWIYSDPHALIPDCVTLWQVLHVGEKTNNK